MRLIFVPNEQLSERLRTRPPEYLSDIEPAIQKKTSTGILLDMDHPAIHAAQQKYAPLRQQSAEAIIPPLRNTGRKPGCGTCADKAKSLAAQQAKAPSRKLILKNMQSVGDIVMLTAVIRDLHLTYPNLFKTDVRTPCSDLFLHNKYITPLNENDPEVKVIDCHYPLIHQSNNGPYHFIHGFRMYLNDTLRLNIKPHKFHGDIHMSKEEMEYSLIDEMTNRSNKPYWLVISGGKSDFTTKHWCPDRMQEVIDRLRDRINFVQVGQSGKHGSLNHTQHELKNVINLVNATSLRELVRLTYHAGGVICPVTGLMHLAAAVPTKPGHRPHRPAVVIAGGREPSNWEAYTHHQFLHTNGCLSCCDNGGCWKSRVVPLGDGDSKDQDLCLKPVTLTTGRIIPKCLDMITADDVVRSVEKFLAYGN